MNQEDRTNQVGTTKETEQYVLNYSFDEIFKILTVGLVAYNPDTNTMDRVQLDSNGGLKSSGFVPSGYDYVGCTYPNATTDVFTFKSGGSGGTTLSTVTITYTDSTKDNMLSVART